VQVVPPQAYFVVSAVFHYLGPSFAVLLFARVDVLGVAWLRIAAAAIVFAALPATAVVVGLVVLGQVPAAAELAGVALVVAGVAIRG